MKLLFKYAITACLVVFISEIAKKSDKLGALIASLPIVTLLVLSWLYIENQSTTKIANHAFYTFWYVLGSLPFFLIFPHLLSYFNFFTTLFFSVLLSATIFYFYALLASRFGILLL